MTRKAEPVAEAEAVDPQRLFRALAGRGGLVLAVSGGSDSTALMVLVSRWRERPPTLVVTVDHGLRPEAAEEARMVTENARRLGFPARIAKAPGRVSKGNVQDWARRVRYRCLAGAAIEAGCDTIVTAHHRDDQAETVLLRLARGSGVYGLAAMRKESSYEGLGLMRPLLDLPRETLAGIAVASGLPTTADPSNSDPRFDRVRIRALMPLLAEHGLTAARLAETAGRLRRAASALDHYALRLIKESFEPDAFGVVRGDACALADAPAEVALRALAILVRAVDGADYTPKLHAIESLRDAVLAAAGGKTKRTLSGVVFAVDDGAVAVHREWGREGLADVAAATGTDVVWDRRFRCVIQPLPGILHVGALGRSDRRLRAAAAGRAVVRALPGLFQNGMLVAVPEGVDATDRGPTLARLGTECLVGVRLGISVDDAGRPG